jgi:hypothetical protein
MVTIPEETSFQKVETSDIQSLGGTIVYRTGY